MATIERHTGPLATHALRQASAIPAEPWSDRTSASHWHEGQEWAVIVDWAVRADGTRVPASVSLSCLGATLGETPLHNVEPTAVTRALVDAVSWASVIANSRQTLADMPGVSGDWAAFRNYERTAAQRAQQNRKDSTRAEHHDEILRLTADIYRAKGGEEVRGIASLVHAELSSRGIQPMRRGPKPEPDTELPEGQVNLSEETVRRWIKEARQRGHLSPSTRASKRTPKNSGHPSGDK